MFSLSNCAKIESLREKVGKEIGYRGASGLPRNS